MANTQADIEVWVALVTSETPPKLLESSSAFPVLISPNKRVNDLKKNIKNESKHLLNHVDANQLKLWKLKEPPLIKDVKGKRLKTTLSTIHLPAEDEDEDESDKVKLFDISDAISELDQSRGDVLHLLVQVPGACIASTYKTSSHAFSHS